MVEIHVADWMGAWRAVILWPLALRAVEPLARRLNGDWTMESLALCLELVLLVRTELRCQEIAPNLFVALLMAMIAFGPVLLIV